MKPKVKKRKMYFEFIRIFACALVIFNHTTGYMLYMSTTGGEQIFYMVFSVITRVNVPLFLMISGALLLKKEETMAEVLKKRISRIAIVMVVAELLMYILFELNALRIGEVYEFSILGYISKLLGGTMDGCTAYWYLYAYLSFLFLLPFLQKVAKQVTGVEILVLLILHFLYYSVLPIANLILMGCGQEPLAVDGNFSVPFAFTAAIFYPLLGYYIEENIDVFNFRWFHILGLIAAGILIVFVTIQTVLYEGTVTGAYTQAYIYVFDYILTFVVYLLIKYVIVVLRPPFLSSDRRMTIITWGSLTFGIYLWDPFFKNIAFYRFDLLLGTFMSEFVISLLWVLLSMVLGGLVIYGLKKIYWFRQIL